MRQLAAETGGSYSAGTSLEGIGKLYDQILEELFSQYSIGYVSSNTKRDGKYRKIRVEVDVKNAKIRARKGYFGPAPEQTASHP